MAAGDESMGSWVTSRSGADEGTSSSPQPSSSQPSSVALAMTVSPHAQLSHLRPMAKKSRKVCCDKQKRARATNVMGATAARRQQHDLGNYLFMELFLRRTRAQQVAKGAKPSDRIRIQRYQKISSFLRHGSRRVGHSINQTAPLDAKRTGRDEPLGSGRGAVFR